MTRPERLLQREGVARFREWLTVGIALVGMTLGVLGFLSMRNARQLTISRDAEVLITEAIDLIGGKEGTVDLYITLDQLKDPAPLELARRKIEEALELRPNNPAAYGAMGKYFLAQHNPEAARMALEKAVALDPDTPSYHNDLGVALAWEGKHDQAVVEYETAISINPYYGLAYENIGNSFYLQCRWEDAVRWYTRANDVDQARPNAQKQLGRALLELGRKKQAIEAFTRSAELKGDPWTMNQLGILLLEAGEAGTAATYFRAALERVPEVGGRWEAMDTFAAYLYLGRALETTGRHLEAIEAYEKAAALDDSELRATALMALASALEQIGEAARAAKIREDVRKTGCCEYDAGSHQDE